MSNSRKRTQTKQLRKGIQINSEKTFEDLDDVAPIVDFLEKFRELADPRAQLPLKLISIKISIPLLSAFRFKCDQIGVPYQTQIKRLMQKWCAVT